MFKCLSSTAFTAFSWDPYGNIIESDRLIVALCCLDEGHDEDHFDGGMYYWGDDGEPYGIMA